MVTAGSAIVGQGPSGVRESHLISLAGLAPSPSGAAAPSGITYTCDPSVAAVAGVCNYLNTTVAGIYAGTFSNASASIYIQFSNIGSGDAGQSNFVLNDVSYSAFRGALQSGLTSASDVTAFNASVPATNPINSAYRVYLTLSGMRALGFTPSGGISSTGGSCGGSTPCYDGIITMSSTIQSAGNYYFRSGSIGSSQYDFFTTVQHETDEIIGTASCAFNACGGSHISPPDLFRYQSNGTRSFGAGNNSACTSANAGNACFSIDGVHMLQHYYNINDGYDAGDWVPACSPELVQGTVCAGVANVNISPTAEILVLDVIGYTLSGTSPAQVSASNQVTSTASGIVSGICTPPPPVSSFTTQSPQVWLFFDYSGANAGDSAQIQFIRPDSVVYTASTSSIATAGSGCLSKSMSISGTAAASFPGVWSVRVTWNQATTALFTLNFTLSPADCTYSLSDGGESFAAAGGNGSIAVTAPAGCLWSATGAPAWVIANSGSGTGNGSFVFQVLSNAGAARVANLAIGGVAFTIQQQAFAVPALTFIGSMPHIAAEENWTTTFTLVDKGASAATARLSLFGDPSGALTLPLVFPQSSGAAPILASSLDQTIAANASLLITTAGPQAPPVEVGSAQLAAAGSVDGFAIFHLIPGAQEAVVPLETRNASSYLLAFDNTGGVVLGVAVENVSSQSAFIPVVIRDDSGTVIGTPGATIFLAGNGHYSFVRVDAISGDGRQTRHH